MNGADGKVTIDTSINTSGIDKGITNIEKKLEKLRNQAEKPYEVDGIEISGGWNLTEEEQKYYDRLSQTLEKLKVQKEQILQVDKSITNEVQKQNITTDGNIQALSGPQITNESDEIRIANMYRILEEMIVAYNDIQKRDIISDSDLKDSEKLKKDILTYKSELEKISNTKIHIKGFEEVNNNIKKIDNSMSKVLKKVAKWGLAVFGVRSIYMLIRRTMSTLSQYNEELANKLEAIQLIIAASLEPIINVIVNLVYKLSILIAQILKSWTGIDIIGRANELMLKKSVGYAKELRKQLAGFDEMNILGDNTKASGTGNNFQIPEIPESIEIDFSKLDEGLSTINIKINEVFGNLKENILKVMNESNFFSKDFINVWGFTFDGLTEIASGAFNIIGGLLEIFLGLATGNTELFEQGVERILNGLWEFIQGLFKFIIGTLGQTIIGIKDVLGLLVKWIYEHTIGKLTGHFTGLWEGIGSGASKAVDKVIGFFKGIPDKISGTINKIKTFFVEFGTKAGDMVGSAFKSAINGALSLVEGILNTPINAINGLLDIINAVPGINLSKLPTLNLPRLAKGGIISQPGRGVPLGIGGEGATSGSREGVIPLTDSQQMALLGEAIGKYIQLSATIPIYVGNRQIAREIRNIDAQSNFATNR